MAPEVAIFGISCHVPDYRLCWAMNRALGLELARRRNDIVEASRGKELHYPVFQQTAPDGMATWTLVCNTCGKRRLISEQKEADFLLLVEEQTANREEDLLFRLRTVEFVLTAYPINWSELRMGHKLLF